MLIRRFMKHVTKQNWFAVGLDFFVVVIGIIIGLQVNNWNDERLSKETIKSYYRHLTNELEVNIQLFDNAIEYYNVVKNYAHLVVKDNDKPANELDSQYIVNIFQATQLYGPSIPLDTITELLSSEVFLKFSNKDLKRKLSSYALSVQESPALNLPISSYRLNILGLIDNNVQQQIRASCGDVILPLSSNEKGVKLSANCNLVLTEKMQIRQIKKLMLYKNLAFDLTYRVSNIDWKIDNYKIFNLKAEGLISSLRELQVD